MTIRHAIALIGLTLAVAGCGGGSTGASSTTGTQAADLVSQNAVVLVSLNTDRDGGQWEQADELLSRFPGRAKLLAQLRQELRQEGLDWERDVVPALGPEVDLALSFKAGQDEPDLVALVKPEDPDKLKELAKKSKEDGPTIVRELEDGWWALTDEQVALDTLLAKDGPTLADQEDFQDAVDAQPDESLVAAYVNMPRVRELIPAAYKQQLDSVPFLKSLAGVVGAIEAVDDGVKLSGRAGGVTQGGDAFESTFVDEVPAGALMFATFNGKSLQLDQLRQSIGGALNQFEQQLGVKLEDIEQLLSGEVAIYVRPAALIPEVTLVAETDDEARAKRTLDTLAQKLTGVLGAKSGTMEAGGMTFTQIPLEGINVSYAVADGRIVITDLPSGAAKLGEGDSLADDEDFTSAADAADMPDETTGFVYVNVADALAVVEALADDVPADVRENIRPLRTLLLYGSRDGDTATVGGFLGIGE